MLIPNAEISEDAPTRFEQLWAGFTALPLMDELFFGMQVRNLVTVDAVLADWELDALRIHIELERTPLPELMTLGAFSQPWIFGVYELLRTWRQQAKLLISFGSRLASLSTEEERRSVLDAEITRFAIDSPDGPGQAVFVSRFSAVLESGLDARLAAALPQTEILFRRLESLRVTLAKHEIPRTSGVPSMSPGYARHDMSDGCMIWPVDLKDGSMDLVSRTSIVEGIIAFAHTRPLGTEL